MERGQITAYFTEESWKEGSPEQKRGRHAKESRKHAADQGHSPCPVHTTTETTNGCSHAQKHIHTAHVNTHVLSVGTVKHMSPFRLKKVPIWLRPVAQSGPESRTSERCDIDTDTSAEESRWSVAWRSCTMVSRHSINSRRGKNDAYLAYCNTNWCFKGFSKNFILILALILSYTMTSKFC